MSNDSRLTLVTGAAGFIGYHLALRLLQSGEAVLGLDNLNSYYDVRLKESRLERLTAFPGFRFEPLDLADRAGMERLFELNSIGRVVHLAAQAGVRYSLTNPHAYGASNLTGFLNILEGCRQARVEHLIFASSSSVYGGNSRIPFSEHDNVDHPVSLYAATKKANEAMAHSYAHLYGLPCTGLRFFTVYGPWGRPDMAIFLFTKAILAGEPVLLFNEGRMKRDFTYVDDIVEGIVRLLDRAPKPDPTWSSETPDPASSSAPYRIYNIGNNQPVELLEFVSILERAIGREAVKQLAPMQAGDVESTYANVDDLMKAVDFRPSTSLEVGIGHFVKWYREYYGV